MSQKLARALIVLTFVCAATFQALAQADVSSATVRGTVTDVQGAAIPNATVNVKDLDQGTVRTDTTDSNGEFQVRFWNDFMMTFQRAVTELAWGYAWSRPGLDQRTRSILTLGILAGLGRFQELGIYTNAAIASGVTVDELKEILVHVTAYCGTPAGRQAFLAAHETVKAHPKSPNSN